MDAGRADREPAGGMLGTCRREPQAPTDHRELRVLTPKVSEMKGGSCHGAAAAIVPFDPARNPGNAGRPARLRTSIA
jgi:hypothetical protein